MKPEELSKAFKDFEQELISFVASIHRAETIDAAMDELNNIGSQHIPFLFEAMENIED